MKQLNVIVVIAIIDSFLIGCNRLPVEVNQDQSDQIQVEQTINNVIGWAIRHEIRDLHIHFSKGGEVAWFFCLPGR